MPQLRPRREAFCRNILKSVKDGTSIAQCYERAGYKTSGHASEANASRLLKDAEIKQRIDELARPAVQKTRISVESLLSELETTIADARAAKQNTVVVQALTLSAKLVGPLKEKVEIEHNYGGDREQILSRLEQRHGREAMDVLRAALDKADYATPLIEKRPRHEIETTGRSEADIALEDVRPRK
jgi:hypothetical protein